jgi:hypothetical protein
MFSTLVLLYLQAKSEPICYGESVPFSTTAGSGLSQGGRIRATRGSIRKLLTPFPMFPIQPIDAEGTDSISAGKRPIGARKTGFAVIRDRLARTSYRA